MAERSGDDCSEGDFIAELYRGDVGNQPATPRGMTDALPDDFQRRLAGQRPFR
ncbi:hypothetical protein RISK_001625 [Rhodopirellula islandica]|uniref:Uncharacterized protein n=1 Tax=Rhodopirellula islandica TaxID=595434 RepID=A0A0J1ELM3_RHOIS|nr:hypothetical protein RISK_001625 [Rhodopirellula islandica]